LPQSQFELNRLLAILALTGILLHTFSKGVIFIHFNLNRTYIAQNLCEKKEQADNCCKGSCHLKKQLKEDDTKSTLPANNLKEKNEIQFFDESCSMLNSPHSVLISLIFVYILPKTKVKAFSVFHPPQA
jgi:hypothetical protein